jgi:hypothetical protein
MPVQTRIEDRREYPSFGQCIYCRAKGEDVDLGDEHLVPLSLGGTAYIAKASCRICADETSKCELELGRKVFYDFRTHIGEKTRRRKERPKELPFTISINNSAHETRTVPVKDHPYFTAIPVWGPPGILTGADHTAGFQAMQVHLFHWIPPNIRETLHLKPEDDAKLIFPSFPLNEERYARAIAKIAYCHAVAQFGLGGFDALNLPDLIIGRESQTRIPFYVGGELADSPPPGDPTVKHFIRTSTMDLAGDLAGNKLIVVEVRIYANSGTQTNGAPIYRIVCGANPKIA